MDIFYPLPSLGPFQREDTYYNTCYSCVHSRTIVDSFLLPSVHTHNPFNMTSAIVSASIGVLSTLLPKLSVLIEGEYKLQKGVKDKIRFLKDELTSIQTLLMKLADKEERLDEQVKDWRNKVRELSYDIEDCIDLFIHKMSKGDHAANNLVKKTSRKIDKIWSRHKIANLIEELKSRVQEESDRRMRYKFDEVASNFS